MLIILPREPIPDAAYWPGRRLLGVLDACGWPGFWVWWIAGRIEHTGVIGPFVIGLAVLFGIRRVRRALWENHRYRFTTWRWGKLALSLLLVGLVMKAVMTA